MSEVHQGGEVEEQQQHQLELPPGFRFHPTDEEIITHYLVRKALDCLFTCLVIADVDLNKCEPWDLPEKAKMGEKEWYFFVHKGRKYPTGTRTNRATASGYWKATGRDKEIFRGRNVLVGMKKTLVFYLGRAPRGEKTPWVMHEYRLEGKLPPNLPRAAKDEWAVCRVFNKDLAAKQQPAQPELPRSDSFPLDDFDADYLFDPELPPLIDDSPLFVDVVDDSKQQLGGGVASTSSSGAMPGTTTIKTEQVIKTEALQQNHPTAPPPLLPQQAAPSYNNSFFSQHPQQQASSSSSRPLFPSELDQYLCGPDDFIDYSNMWKI